MDPSPQTLVVATVSFVAYMVLLVVRVVRNRLDFNDFILLSAVCAVPAVFLYFPGFSAHVSRLAGVSYPFLLLFGAVIVAAYLFAMRIAIRLNELKQRTARLTQELALLRVELDAAQKGSDRR